MFEITPPNPNDEIRIINSKKYLATKTKCTCPCHSSNIKHISACCVNGYVEHFKLIENE